MNSKLPSSIKNLRIWSERILADGSKGRKQLRYFVQDFDIKNYRKFYHELLPFLEDLAKEESDMFHSHVIKYADNLRLLDDALYESYWTKLLDDYLFGLTLYPRYADDLLAAIKEIRGNVENIEYGLTIL